MNSQSFEPINGSRLIYRILIAVAQDEHLISFEEEACEDSIGYEVLIIRWQVAFRLRRFRLTFGESFRDDEKMSGLDSHSDKVRDYRLQYNRNFMEKN